MWSKLICLVALALVGCESTVKIEDAVAPPPPERIGTPGTGSEESAVQQAVATALEPSSVEQAAATTSDDRARTSPFSRASLSAEDGKLAALVVARVGDDVVFARDCIEPVRPQLAQAQQQMSAQEFAKYRDQLVRKQLRAIVERKLLLTELKREVKEPQLKLIRTHAARDFQEKVQELMQKTGSATDTELAAVLRSQGTSLERLRKSHEDNFLAEQYLRSKLRDQILISRRDMLDYYREHSDEYVRPARVKWQNIEVPMSEYPSRKAALEKAQELAGLLVSGADFGVLARWQSKGPLASKGGHWDWTSKGSYAVEIVDRAIFEIPVGQVSEILEGPDSFHLVKVVEREEKRIVPFHEAQAEIEGKLRQAKLREAAAKYLDGLLERTRVETIFGDLGLRSQT